MPSPAALGLYGLAAGVLIGLLFVVAGIAGLVRRALALRKRLEGYAVLPVWKDVELAEARIDIAERAVAALPTLQIRAALAARELSDALGRARSSLWRVSTAVGLLFTLVFGD